jgi:hypothetical protein
VVILVNLVLLVNLVIAILSETYTRLSTKKLGLYYDGLIAAIPIYKYKKNYGALICAVPPFNLLVLPFLPIFVCTRKKEKLTTINNWICKLIFVPIASIISAVFIAGNALMLPFAYILTVFKKAHLIIFSTGESVPQRELLWNFIFFLIMGPFMLVLSQVTDFYYFFKHLFLFKTDKLSTEIVPIISQSAFDTLEAVVLREVRRLTSKNVRSTQKMKA